jgi:hypothetical protein
MDEAGKENAMTQIRDQLWIPPKWRSEEDRRKGGAMMAYDAAAGSAPPFREEVAEPGNADAVSVLLGWCKKNLSHEERLKLSEALQLDLEQTVDKTNKKAGAEMGLDERFPGASRIKVDNYGEQRLPPRPVHAAGAAKQFAERYPGAARIKIA